ncbi:hybrid sensor histidine kinase/response regulator [Opitutus sp. ER46]|uniref:hybrid sensor histidine kinase/response regulator n=1 Tax=Opitutus sp. ER46 TaxID=2161864 RepID=UPI000D2F6077|nr:hybrid sensor histidine kinase/response regulator [Opitutus sp. ER46]PTX94454.1 hypothetical protein DB354_11960 [Opitutus sp. ER46]
MRALQTLGVAVIGICTLLQPPLAGSEAAVSRAGYPLLSIHSNEEVGSGVTANAAVQDPTGVIHFAADGIFSFDGERWQKTTAPGLQRIFGIDLAPDGRLWAAQDGEVGWFERQPDGGWSYRPLPALAGFDPAPEGPVFQVLAEKQGAVFLTMDTVYRWDGAKLHAWRMAGSRRLYAFRVGDEIYVHDRNAGLLRLGANGPELVVAQAAIGDPATAVHWLEPLPGGGWLFATGRGLVRYQAGRSEPFAPEVSRRLSELALTCGTRLPDGRVAFGTLWGGIVFMAADGSLDRTLSEADGLPSVYIKSLFVDHEGNLWVTSTSQVLRLSLDPATRIFDERARLAPQIPYRIIRAMGRIMLANAGGVYALAPDERQFERMPSLSSAVHDIVARGDDLLVCGYRGAWRISPSGASTPVLTSRNDAATAIASRARPGELLVLEYPKSQVVAVRPDGSSYPVVTDIPGFVTWIAEDNQGRLWLANERGHVLLAPFATAHPVRAQPLPASFQLPNPGTRTGIRTTAHGDVIVFGERGGWFKPADADVFLPIQRHPARPVLGASDFSLGDSGWLIYAPSESQAAAVAQIVIDRGIARWVPYEVPGLSTIGVPRCIFTETDADGATVLWIAGTRAVLRHRVAATPVVVPPAAPLLRAFARPLDSEALTPVFGRLPYTTRAVDFEFAAPEFARRNSLRLQTRIDGVDADWVPAAPDSRRELTALRDGRYTFRVRAVAETGAASEPTTLSFEVAPPWWRSAPVVVLALAALFPAIYLVFRLRVKALQRRNELLEQKVRERTEELAEASAAKTMFVANMSHDIRNPLNGIVGLALALEDTRLDSQQRDLVATLRECTTYLSSLVDDVLDFASIEAGRIELRPGPYSPAELLNSVVAALKAQAAERDVTIAIETDPELPPVLRGDAGRIQQILVNYLSNAIKYAGGDIRLGAMLAANAPGEVEFHVSDEGPGISAAEQATLFTKFTRLPSRREQAPGTGLGLAACRLLADAMGGLVGVESEPGRGACFFLRLPLIIAHEAPVAATPAALPRATVLLVEDTDYNALAATAVLARLGLTCDRARDGAEAIRLFGEKRHNIVLLDRNLPDLDGTEVAQRLRELENDGTRSVLLAVTAYCTREDRARCLKAGMDAFIGKPLTPEKLRRVLIDAGRRLLLAPTMDATAGAPDHDLNTTLLEYLAEGKEGGLSTQVERFLAALENVEAEINEAHAQADLPALATAAHRLLGQARMIGATRLVDAATELENAARRADEARLTAVLAQIPAEVGLLKGALRRRPGAQRV